MRNTIIPVTAVLLILLGAFGFWVAYRSHPRVIGSSGPQAPFPDNFISSYEKGFYDGKLPPLPRLLTPQSYFDQGCGPLWSLVVYGATLGILSTTLGAVLLTVPFRRSAS